jgi:hypothetical protein
MTLVASALICLPLSGCGSADDIQKVVVSGQVQFQGKPLPAGQIMFYPIEETRGPVSVAAIFDGRYLAESKGGVPVGKHRIKIEGYRKPTSAPPGMDLEELGREQYLPPKYNSDSELTADLTIDESPAIRDFSLSQ